MAVKRQQPYGERARLLARVILGRRDDLVVREMADGTGLDWHVYIAREDNPMRLAFGVLIRTVVEPVTPAAANKILKPTVGQFIGMRKFTYPVCVFFLTMRDDAALFSWLAEPALTAAGPKLVHHAAADCVELTNAKLAAVVDQVVAWYDAVEPVLTA